MFFPSVFFLYCVSSFIFGSCSPSVSASVRSSESESESVSALIPSQFHVSYAGDNSMRISFKLQSNNNVNDNNDNDYDSNDVAAAVPVECSYGLSPNALSLTSSPSSVRSYFANHGYYHHVELTDLHPLTEYWYSCLASNVTRIVSPPSPSSFSVSSSSSSSSSAFSLSLGVFADWGYLGASSRGSPLPCCGLYPNWTAYLVRDLLDTLHVNKEIDAVIIPGDISYADDAFANVLTLASFQYENVTDGWFEWISNVSSSIPFMVAVGNHESECHSPYCLLHLNETGLPLSNFSAYNSRWAMPSVESGGKMNMWYSWNYGPVHFVAINTETDYEGAEEESTGDGHFAQLPAGKFGSDGEYLKWLASDLQAASSSPSVQWIVTYGHRPFEDLPDSHRDLLVDLFAEAAVDVYLCGHGHTYARFNETAWGDGAVHLMVGASGSDETPLPLDQFDDDDHDDHDDDDHGGEKEREMIIDREMRGSGEHAKRKCENYCATASSPHHACLSTCALNPVVFTDKLSLGRMTINETLLEFTLLRAPDGVVLDRVTISPKQRLITNVKNSP